MKSHSSGLVPASDKPGNMQYSPIEPAPGRYVKEKSN
jgi:polyhydroxyalkanoate synthase